MISQSGLQISDRTEAQYRSQIASKADFKHDVFPRERSDRAFRDLEITQPIKSWGADILVAALLIAVIAGWWAMLAVTVR